MTSLRYKVTVLASLAVVFVLACVAVAPRGGTSTAARPAAAVAAAPAPVRTAASSDRSEVPAKAAAVVTAPAPAPSPDPPYDGTPGPESKTLAGSGFNGDIAPVLADLRTADRQRREAWVAAGYSNDLQVLVNAADMANGTDRTDVDARRFSTAGAAYLAAYENGLGPGWQDAYAQVRAALNVIAADRGLKPVPAPGARMSTAPDLSNPPGYTPPAMAAPACTSATTTTNSTSSTGAHSQSTSVKTTCGTATSTVKNGTSVSAKGVVTHTTTTTTGSSSGSGSTSSGSG